MQPSLYQEYKIYGFEYIPLYTDIESLPEEFVNFAKQIYDSYGELDGDELEALNHSEEPWLNARGNLKPWQGCNRIISEEDMKEYYRGIMDNDE